jgi:hypothetical protein
MKIFFVNDYFPETWQRERILTMVDSMRLYGVSDTSQKHQIASNEMEADVYLFSTHIAAYNPLDSDFYRSIRQHPLIRKYPNQCFLWCDKDFPLPILPGLYASLDQGWFNPDLHRTFCYATATNPYVEELVLSNNLESDLLCSFMGSISSPVRSRILSLNFKRVDIYFRETPNMWDGLLDNEKYKNNQIEYANILRRSKFVLCPKGNGVSSYRLFEVMQAGRVPVIISDKWVPLKECNWEDFSLKVNERGLHQLSFLLEAYEPQAEKMGVLARETWEKWFDPKNRLHSIGELIESIQNSRREVPFIWHQMQWLLSISKYVIRHNQGRLQRQTINTLKSVTSPRNN